MRLSRRKLGAVGAGAYVLGAAVLFGFAAVMAGAAAETGAPTVSHLNLADSARPRIERVQTSYIPFNDKTSYHCLLDGWKTRWWEQLSFSNMLWTTSLQSSIQVNVFVPADRMLTLRMAPYEGSNPKLPAQRVTVLWNGKRIGQCDFVKKDGWALKAFRLPVPAAVQKSGKNSITLLSRYAVIPHNLHPKQYVNRPNAGRDPIGIGMESLSLTAPTPDTGAAATSPPPQSDFDRTAASLSGHTITQTVNSRITFPLKLPAAAHCVFSLEHSIASDKDVSGRVTARWDTPQGPREKLLATHPAGSDSTKPVSVDISALAGSIAEVIFQVTTPLGTPADASLQWKSPEITLQTRQSATPAPAPHHQATPHIPRADDVLFILLDACRADTMSCYGYGRETTPFIDTLARRGMVFERAYSGAPYTYSSTFCFYTSLFPFEHGAPMIPKRPSNLLPTVQKTLHKAGIVTGFACANPWSANTGMSTGFDEYLPAFEHIFTRNPPVRTPGTVTHRAIDFMFRHRKQRFFLYAHYMLPHEPYLPPPPFANHFTVDPAHTLAATSGAIWSVNFKERGITTEELRQLKARYDENLLSGDAEVKQLFQALKTLGLDKKTLVIITADHGESFMEHGVLSHDLTVYEEVMHIPLIIYGPMLGNYAGKRITRIVRNVDYFPTICDVMGVKKPDSLEGRDLFLGPDPALKDKIQAYGEATFDRHPLEAYWWRRYKLIRDDYDAAIEVYDLKTDPKEKNNLAAARPVLADYLLANARSWKEKHSEHIIPPISDVKIGPKVSTQLKALGYLGY